MKTLVIGYGNSLRGDDGVGYVVAERVAGWNLPEMRSIAVHQLTPELAAEIAEVDRVFFVDACLDSNGKSPPRIESLPSTSVASPTSSDHAWSPSLLIHLAKTLYDTEPVAYQILIPARQFNYGETLSETAIEGLAWSLKTLEDYSQLAISN
jgi:hydrogenase maturation protease